MDHSLTLLRGTHNLIFSHFLIGLTVGPIKDCSSFNTPYWNTSNRHSLMDHRLTLLHGTHNWMFSHSLMGLTVGPIKDCAVRWRHLLYKYFKSTEMQKSQSPINTPQKVMASDLNENWPNERLESKFSCKQIIMNISYGK